jgi:arylsulfatase A
MLNTTTRGACICFGAFLIAEILGNPRIAAETRPNFMVILCDDLGYGDLACFGSKTIKTPNLDKLASQGLRLTDCYSTAPVCSPSRAGLLTGRCPSRVGVYDWIPGGHVMHLRKEEVTIAALLRNAGYSTCHVGKWHCNGKFNSKEQPQPGDHGFEHWFATQNNAAPTHRNPKNFVRNGEPVGEIEGYSSHIVVDEAIRWLSEKRNESKPFFQFVCFHEPHEPIDSPPELVAKYPQASKRGEALYYANVTNMDAAVGRLMKALEELKLSDNTLVFFTSDNGPETLNRYRGAWRSHGSPGPLRGMKLHLYEAGIRVPGILRFPGRTKAGQVVTEPVCALDILPTFCELAGVAGPRDRALDGTSFVSLFGGKSIERKTPLYWHYHRSIGEPKAAMRVGDWMILGHWDGPALGPGGSLRPGDMKLIKESKLVEFELFNLKDDLTQKSNVAAEHSGKLAELRKLLIAKYEDVQKEGPEWKLTPSR